MVLSTQEGLRKKRNRRGLRVPESAVTRDSRLARKLHKYLQSLQTLSSHENTYGSDSEVPRVSSKDVRSTQREAATQDHGRAHTDIRQETDEEGNSYGAIYANDRSCVVAGNVSISCFHDCDKSSIAIQRKNIFSQPASSIDRAPWSKTDAFPLLAPSAYTVSSKESTLSSISVVSVSRSSSWCTYLATFIYRPTFREVMQVDLCVVINNVSEFWDQIEPDNPARGGGRDLPKKVVTRLKKWLRKNQASTTHLQIGVALSKSMQIFGDTSQWISSSQRAFSDRVLQITNTFDLSCCEWYYEKDLARRHLYTDWRSCESLVCHPRKRTWVREVRFSMDKLLFEAQVYTLRTLYDLALRQCALAGRFAGIIRDCNDMIVAFMSEVPKGGWLATLMFEASRNGQPIPLSRRLKWCRQLVEIVAEVHRHGQVLGMLGLALWWPWCCLSVNDDDSIEPWILFRPHISTERLYPGTIPPELRPLVTLTKATAQTDLFQLGLMLWMIAGNNFGTDTSYTAAFCHAFGCQTSSTETCGQAHTDPVALPMSAPDYGVAIRAVITICRSEHPSQRMPAVDLLQLFNIESMLDKNVPKMPDATHASAEDLQRMYAGPIVCDQCVNLCGMYSYHCEVCNNSDFDLCATCLGEGYHCPCDDHDLVEFRERKRTFKRYGCAGEGGVRLVVEEDEDWNDKATS